MTRVLLAYSTVDGHTREISKRIAELLTVRGHEVTLQEIGSDSIGELGNYDKFVIGASIRYGNYRPQLQQFLNSHVKLLNGRPSAFFSVNLVARKTGRDSPKTNPYIGKLFSKCAWNPGEIAVFAGKLDYARYRFLDKQIIRLIMWLTGGPVDPRASCDYTNWERVAEFAERIAALKFNKPNQLN